MRSGNGSPAGYDFGDEHPNSHWGVHDQLRSVRAG